MAVLVLPCLLAAAATPALCAHVIAALQADGEFALAESQLKKRAASTGSPGRVVRQRTDAGSPTAAPAAAAPAAAAMDETAEAS